MKLKVIHFITAIDRSLGGVSIYMQLLAKELGKLVDLTVVTRPTSNPLHLENCNVIYLPYPMSKLHEFTKQWKLILKHEKPDIVHINGIWMIQTWIIQKEAIKLNIPTFITPHGMLEPWILQRNSWKKKLALQLFQKKALKMAKALIATADSEKENILKLKFNNNIITIPNGIDVSEIPFQKTPILHKKLLYLSRIHPKKGVELLIEVIYSLKEELKEYEIIIAGEGEQEYINQLQQQLRNHDIQNVKFIGGVYNEAKWQLYTNADCFILPTFSENFGYVIAESLACGTPVITTQGTPWQDLETYQCGLWIDRNKENLIAAIKKILSMNYDDIYIWGKNGRQLIQKKYTTQIMAQKLYQLYTLK